MAVRSTPKIRSRWLRRSKAGRGRGCGAGSIGQGHRALIFVMESLDALLNFLIAVGNELLVVTVGGQRLFQREDVLGTIVADQAFRHGFDGGFDSVVSQFG